jgi:hypothetical protein
MKFYFDDTGELEKYFEKIQLEHFASLAPVKWLYTWREGEKLDDEGRMIAASVRKLSSKDRDIFGYDVAIEVDADYWKKMKKKDKFRVAFHELLHVELEYDEDDEDFEEPFRDNEGRVKIWMNDHDIVIKRFEAELKKFGLSKDENKIRRFLNKVYKKHKKK